MLEEVLKSISWLGHDCFLIAGKKKIYFDPFQITSGPTADIIFISHEHFDHCSPDDVKKIQGPNTIIVTEKDSAKKLTGNIKIVQPGDKITIDDVMVEVVPAYNTDKNFHPKSNKWLGFIVTVNGVRLYHAGDTDFIPEMKDVKVDIAFIPVSGTYVMDAPEGIKAALAINPKVAIPMHYGAIVGSASDAKAFAEALKGKIRVEVLKKK
ncbi:MAG: MBL fold metallo-hydrolase [Deltaproteobacteria bacterium]|nr:MBL fold metallo-hydrolase [Deltaproteobacteria bacterium]